MHHLISLCQRIFLANYLESRGSTVMHPCWLSSKLWPPKLVTRQLASSLWTKQMPWMVSKMGPVSQAVCLNLNLGPTWGFMLKHLVQRARKKPWSIYGNSILYWFRVLRMCRLSNPYFVPLAVAPLFFSSGRSTGFWMTGHACNVDCVCWKAGCGRFTISSSLYSLLHHLKIRRCHFHIFGLAWTFRSYAKRLRRPATHKWVVCSMI